MMSMYSLYRAWLLRDTPSIASPSLSLPPDLLLTLPPSAHTFFGHRTLVSSHSGWLKAAITAQEAYAKTQPTSEGESDMRLNAPLGNDLRLNAPLATDTHPYPGMLEVSLPSSIPADTFSPLLTFMYTGYLDLNLHNIYELLLAANILQMPHALDLCRSYLLHNVHSVANLTFNNTNSLAKPIPASFGHKPPAFSTVAGFTNSPQIAKPVPGKLAFPGELHSVAPPPTGNLPRELQQTDISSMTITPVLNNSHLEGLGPRQISPTSRHAIKRNAKTHKRRHLHGRRSRKFPKLDATQPLVAQNVVNPRDGDSNSSDDELTVVTTERLIHGDESGQTAGSAYGIDIASCDGPVHFTRVLNENYNTLLASNVTDEAKTPNNNASADFKSGGDRGDNSDAGSDSEINIDDNSSEGEENEENIARNRETEASFRVSFRHQIQRQNTTSVGGETASREDKRHTSGVDTVGATGGHSRSNQRRVIPRTVLRPVAPGGSGGRLLDMNVQYYPCKSCGAKFPSYYFVHKHRRRVHPEEEGEKVGGGGEVEGAGD